MAYDILIPSLPFVGGYIYTYALYRAGAIKKSLHVNFWNFIIGIAFLVSGGAGFILLILLDLGVSLPISAGMLYWHVELGITLVMVGIFHFHTYWKSSRKMLEFKRRIQV